MKYCDNCGAQLEDDATFCDECGAKQDDFQNAYESVASSEGRGKKKGKGAPLIVICLLLILGVAGLGGYYWLNNRDVSSEPAGSEQKREEAAEKQSAEKQPTAEQSPSDEGQKEEEESSDSNLAFIGRLDQSYQAEGLQFDTVITISGQKGNVVDVNINIADGLYDITYYGMMTSDSIIQISLDGGEKINLMWQSETMFHAVPADGFTDDSIRMMKMMCESLDNKTYQVIEGGKKSSVKAVHPPEGTYWEGGTAPHYARYYMEISNVTDQGFDFVIYARNSEEEDYRVAFVSHTAVYTDTYTATYYGQEYTLTFQWQELGYMTVKGFEERIPSGSSPLYNNAYLGVS